MTIDSYEALPQSGGVNGGRARLWVAWRWIALVTLFAWVSAFGICTAHCALGMAGPSMGNSPIPPCHGSGQSPDSDPEPGGSRSFCFTVKSLSFETFPPVLQVPEAPALFQPILASTLAGETYSAPANQATRQGDWFDLLLTPEVSLGPAHFPHAPPVLP